MYIKQYLLCMFSIVLMQHPPSAAQTITVTLTTYHAVATECDGNPLTTADGTKIVPSYVNSGRQRIVSVSRDLLKKFPYGTHIYIEGYGIYIVHDTMNRRFRNRIDILIPIGHKCTKTNVNIKRLNHNELKNLSRSRKSGKQ